MRYLGMAFAAVFCAAVPTSGQAATQTIPFTVDVTGSGSSPVPPETVDIEVSSASFPGFNPSLGTLTEITETVTGSTVVTTSPFPTTRGTVFVRLNDVEAPQQFSPTEPINIDLTGTTMDAGVLARFTGGMPSVVVEFVVTLVGGALDSTVSASVSPSTLDGAITYTFTPSSTPVPEPSTWAMMFIGFGGLGFLGYRQTRRAKPQAALRS